MSQTLRRPKKQPSGLDPKDPYRYGWRYVKKLRPDGSEITEQVPLSWEDLLYPEEGDFVMQEPVHTRDNQYCYGTLDTRYQNQDDVVVLSDCRVDWGVEGIRPLGPDIVVLFGVRQWRRRGTFQIATEGGRPRVVMELTSPATREHDLGRKKDLFFRAGVQWYVILDRGPEGADPLRLLGFRRGRKRWIPLPLDERGRLLLPPLGLELGVEDDRPWFYDVQTGERIPDFVGAMKERDTAQARARKESRARGQAETKARAAETKARAAETKARAAEAKAREEAEACAALEKRVRELEEQLRRQGQK